MSQRRGIASDGGQVCVDKVEKIGRVTEGIDRVAAADGEVRVERVEEMGGTAEDYWAKAFIDDTKQKMHEQSARAAN